MYSGLWTQPIKFAADCWQSAVIVKKFNIYPDSHGQQSAIRVKAKCLLHILKMPSNKRQGAWKKMKRLGIERMHKKF